MRLQDGVTVCFIGGGNMAGSLIGGMIAQGQAPEAVHVIEPVETIAAQLRADFGVQVYADSSHAHTALQQAQAWVLAVKPQVMRAVCEALQPALPSVGVLAVSIAAGITTTQLEKWLGDGARVVRCMPNTPALLGAGVTGLFASAQVSQTQRVLADSLLQTAGQTVWVDDEGLMDAVTAVSGSGPAYVFLLAEAMQAAGQAQGLSEQAARTLTIQTLLGAAKMLAHSDVDAAELRRRVTSPGGTTQAAIETFEAGDLRGLVDKAIAAARKRGALLSAAQE